MNVSFSLSRDVYADPKTAKQAAHENVGSKLNI